MAAPITQIAKYKQRVVVIELEGDSPELPRGAVWIDRMNGLCATVHRTPARAYTIAEAYKRGLIPTRWVKRHFPDVYRELLAESRKPFDYAAYYSKHPEVKREV